MSKSYSDRARGFAAKWVAESELRQEHPTDEAMQEAFKHCVLPPKADMYPLIREYIENWN
jgi:hypothetical protein